MASTANVKMGIFTTFSKKICWKKGTVVIDLAQSPGAGVTYRRLVGFIPETVFLQFPLRIILAIATAFTANIELPVWWTALSKHGGANCFHMYAVTIQASTGGINKH